MPTNAPTALLDNAVVLVLRQSAPGNSRQVRSTDVSERPLYGAADGDSPISVAADKSMVQVSKHLFDSQDYKNILRYDAQTRDWLLRRAVPSYFREGFYLVPLALLDEIDASLEERRQIRQRLIQAFLDTYELKVSEARTRLRELFAESDYPTVARMAASFSFDIRYLTFSVPATLEDISKTLFAREQAKAEAQWQTAAEEIRVALRQSIAELIDRMVDRLTPDADGRPKQFREALIDNLTEFLDYFEARNLTKDDDLSDLVERAKAVMTGVDVKTLRQNATIRESMRQSFSRLQDQLQPMLRPIRGITFDDE